ncbi:MAG: ribosome biogenesis GTPase Der [Firmicutes bacterium]|jgi:GTP-binding protein|nr:ribosome biogenesis GTPase Der [Bacillota bacterium]
MATVALVGRPNVGKSALFNRLTQTRRAIVQDEPGVTRDRLYETTEWNGVEFSLVDTGGLFEAHGDEILGYVRRQTETAIREADVLCLVVDASAPMTATDVMVAGVLRRTKKPVLVAANKVEGFRVPDFREVMRLGLGEPIPVSALHGEGTGDLLDAMVRALEPKPEPMPAGDGPEEGQEEAQPVIRLAIAGRPNVGKSSLLNVLVGEERALVTPIAGTTRDVVDAPLERAGRHYLLLDTAGLRRPNKIDEELEERTVGRTLEAIRRADVVLLVLDETSPLTHQDLRIAGQIRRHHRATVVLPNKADLIRGSHRSFLDKLGEELDFLNYARVLPVSALTGWRTEEIWALVDEAYDHFAQRISTRALNNFVRETVALTPPPTRGTRQLKILYATQVGTCPPHIVLFVNDPELAHFSWMRHLENRIRRQWDFTGTPIRFTLRPRTQRERPAETP